MIQSQTSPSTGFSSGNAPAPLPKSNSGPVREWDYPLNGGPIPLEAEQGIIAKSLSRYRDFYRYWLPSQKKGHDSYKKTVGVILNSAEREEYHRQDKIIIESPELMPKINALEGM